MKCAVRAIGMEEVHPEFFPIGGESRWSVHIRSSSAKPPIINCNNYTFFRLSSFALSCTLNYIYSVYRSDHPSIHLLANEGACMEKHASSEASSTTKLQCSFLSCQSIDEMILERLLVLTNSKRLIRGTVYPNSGRQREASRLKMESKVSDIYFDLKTGLLIYIQTILMHCFYVVASYGRYASVSASTTLLVLTNLSRVGSRWCFPPSSPRPTRPEQA